MSLIPDASVLVQCAKVAVEKDKPIFLDYYADSLEGKCCVGVSETEKYLVKSSEEYTSTIEVIIKCESCYFVITENSIYVVSSKIQAKKIKPIPKEEE